MLKGDDPAQLAVDILERSTCSVKVGAAIADATGRIMAWGWNNSGDGFGQHAECHAIRRANKRRLKKGGATIYVATVRARNDKVIMSKPCEDCQKIIDSLGLKVVYRDALGAWRRI